MPWTWSSPAGVRGRPSRRQPRRRRLRIVRRRDRAIRLELGAYSRGADRDRRHRRHELRIHAGAEGEMGLSRGSGGDHRPLRRSLHQVQEDEVDLRAGGDGTRTYRRRPGNINLLRSDHPKTARGGKGMASPHRRRWAAEGRQVVVRYVGAKSDCFDNVHDACARNSLNASCSQIVGGATNSIIVLDAHGSLQIDMFGIISIGRQYFDVRSPATPLNHFAVSVNTADRFSTN